MQQPTLSWCYHCTYIWMCMQPSYIMYNALLQPSSFMKSHVETLDTMSNKCWFFIVSTSNSNIYFEFPAWFWIRATEGLAGLIGQALLPSLGIIEILKIEILKKFIVLSSKILKDIKKTWGILDENGVKVQKGKIPS